MVPRPNSRAQTYINTTTKVSKLWLSVPDKLSLNRLSNG